MKVQEFINKLQSCNPNDEIEIIAANSIKLEIRTTRTELNMKDNTTNIIKNIIAIFYPGRNIFKDIVIFEEGEIIKVNEQNKGTED